MLRYREIFFVSFAHHILSTNEKMERKTLPGSWKDTNQGKTANVSTKNLCKDTVFIQLKQYPRSFIIEIAGFL
ncbi:MAG: hypothetical protein H6Q14_1125 [Bacteroidetes bacterium]|nr:hypothetical protein [Bacteroidota bacterium]